MGQKDFHEHAHRLVGKDIEVITMHGTFRGTLLSVESNFIIIRTRIRGRVVQLLIREAQIIALFSLIGTSGGSLGFTPSRHTQHENDALSNYPIDTDW